MILDDNLRYNGIMRVVKARLLEVLRDYCEDYHKWCGGVTGYKVCKRIHI